MAAREQQPEIKEHMWVTRKSHPARNLQNQLEMKQLQESKVFAELPTSADLFLIAWNDSSWQHKSNLSSLERRFKGRRHFLAWGKSWAGNSGFKAHNGAGTILKSASAYYNTTHSYISCSLFHTKHIKIATGETWKSETASLCQRHLKGMMIWCYGFKQWFKTS